MFENYPNYGSIVSDREDEERMMQEKRERCHKRGKLYSILFWLSVLGTPAIFAVSLIGGIIAAVFNSLGIAYLVIGFLGIISLGIGITTGVVLLILGKEESCFNAAAIAYIIVSVLNTVNEFLPDSLLKTVFNIVVLIAGLFYLFEFINGSIHILAGVDDYTASSWESIKKAYTIIIIVIVVCALVMIIPVLNILAAFALLIVGIAGLIIFIWELVLMYKTARALKNF